MVVAFYDRAAALRACLPALRKAIYPDRSLWIAWPKQSSGVQTDLNGNGMRTLGIEHALVDTEVAAINETWSGLKFVVRSCATRLASSQATGRWRQSHEEVTNGRESQ